MWIWQSTFFCRGGFDGDVIFVNGGEVEGKERMRIVDENLLVDRCRYC